MSCIIKHLITPFTICGDFNAHITIWGRDHCDARGHLSEDAINKYGVALFNDSSITFMSGHSNTRCLDLSMCSSNFASCVTWRTDFETRDSDHTHILIHHPKLLCSRNRRRFFFLFQNWKAFSFFNTASLYQITTIEDFTRCVSKNLKQATPNLPVWQGHVGSMREYERLGAIRRQAERRCDEPDVLKHTRKLNKFMARCDGNYNGYAAKLKALCETFTTFTPVVKVYDISRSLNSPAV